LQIFSLQFCKFSVILCFNLYKILDFDWNKLYIHFCFSKLFFREKKFADFFGGQCECKKVKFSKNIETTTYKRVAKKRYKKGTVNHTFFVIEFINIRMINIILLISITTEKPENNLLSNQQDFLSWHATNIFLNFF